ncbi:hypothetical protein BJ742DRAFT_832587 [Cladochytrium replicatum]|nr:hypothetical protein BJ742DRAFT_832587 [Cladochytrium replicatum]
MEELHLAIYYAIPFVVLLLGIALLPLFSAHLWERYYWLYGLLCSLSFIIPFAAQYGALQVVYELVHSLLLDYVPFITLIFALYVTAGGIVVEGTLSGTPLTNTLLLLVAAPLASLIGTTGASMLLVRPLIRSISHRVYQRHTVVFFIFVASNVAGSMTPIGDPPVYLGFLKGVDFFWPLLNVWEPTLVVIGALLVMYYVYDLHLYRREQKLGLAHHHHHDEEVALEPKDDHEEKTVVDIVVETDGVKDMQRVDTEATVVGDIEFIASNEDSREASSNSMGVSRSETSGHVAKFLTPPSHAESGSPAQLKDDATKSSIVPLGLYPLRQDDEVSPSLRSKPSFTGSVGSRPSLNARQSGSRPVSQNASIKSVASSIMHEVVAAVMGEDEENEEGGVDSDAWSVVESLKPPKRWALPVWIEGWANVVLTTGVVVVVVISGYLKKAFGEYGFTVMRNPHNDAEEM